MHNQAAGKRGEIVQVVKSKQSSCYGSNIPKSFRKNLDLQLERKPTTPHHTCLTCYRPLLLENWFAAETRWKCLQSWQDDISFLLVMLFLGICPSPLLWKDFMVVLLLSWNKALWIFKCLSCSEILNLNPTSHRNLRKVGSQIFFCNLLWQRKTKSKPQLAGGRERKVKTLCP